MGVTVTNTDTGLDGNTLLTEEGNFTITGTHTYTTAPVISADLTLVDNIKLTLGTGGDVDLYYDGTDVILNTAVAGTGDFVITGGSVELDDSESLTLGTGKDATILYDGTDLVINPKAVGSGNVKLSGDLDMNSNTITGAVVFDNALSGITTIGSSGAATLDSGGTGSSFGGALTVTGDLTVSGVGPHAFGSSTLDYAQFRIGGAFTSGGASTFVAGLYNAAAITAANGDAAAYGSWFAGSITTQGNSETHTNIATLRLNEPNITVGTGDTVTTASTLYIASAPTEGTDNWALYADAGDVAIDDNLYVGADGSGTRQLWVGSNATGAPTNANMTAGIVVDQGGADDEALALKSSDVAHGMTTLAETDTYGAFLKHQAGAGALGIRGYGEGQYGVFIIGNATTVDTTKTTSANAPVHLDAALKSGTSTTAVSSNGNLLVVDNNGTASFVVDAEGDYHYNGADGGAFDAFDDALMVRALDLAANAGSVIKGKWDEYVKYAERDLIDAKILGAPVAEGGLINGAQLQRLHNGAIWQLHTRIAELGEQLALTQQKLAALEA